MISPSPPSERSILKHALDVGGKRMKKRIAEAQRRDKALRDTIVATIAALNGDPLRLAVDNAAIEKRKP